MKNFDETTLPRCFPLGPNALALCMAPMLFFACGGSTGEDPVSAEINPVTVASTFDDLPPCDSTSEGALTFVTDESVYYVCVDGTYQGFGLGTEAGRAGADGQNGEPGMTGEPGQDVVMSDEPPGGNCAYGGVAVSSGETTTYVCSGAAGVGCSIEQGENAARITCGDGVGGAGGESGTAETTIAGLSWLGALDAKPENPQLNQAFFWKQARTSCIWDGDSWEVYGASEDSRPGGCDPYTRVFLSSSTVSGNLGGYAGGDAECQRLADAQGFGGRWAAWISDSTSSPALRFTKNTIPYRLLGGTLLAQNWVDLTDGVLGVDIKSDELGNENILSRVFTGTDANGNARPTTCLDWTSESNEETASFGASGFGDDTDTPFHWSDRGQNECDQPIRLYCFEQ